MSKPRWDKDGSLYVSDVVYDSLTNLSKIKGETGREVMGVDISGEDSVIDERDVDDDEGDKSCSTS